MKKHWYNRQKLYISIVKYKKYHLFIDLHISNETK